ncbi:hypothetical protein [Selenomonas sp.]|nr:hypothetical protein [Selenomonas sp.]
MFAPFFCCGHLPLASAFPRLEDNPFLLDLFFPILPPFSWMED